MIAKTITKVDLLKQIKENRAKLEDLISNVLQEDIFKPIEGKWSTKDIMSHIISWEQNMIRWMDITLAGGAPDDFPVTRDEVEPLNEFQYQREKDKTLDVVLKEFQDSYKQALSYAEGLDEKIINDPDLFEWRKGDAIWYLVSANTHWHYEEHFELFENLDFK
jgi:hypothetical protein